MSRTVFAGRFHRVGGSRGIVIPKPVCERLQFVEGDLTLMTVYGGLLIVRKVSRQDVVDSDEIPTEAIPPKVPRG